jgi:hypothetical protein
MHSKSGNCPEIIIFGSFFNKLAVVCNKEWSFCPAWAQSGAQSGFNLHWGVAAQSPNCWSRVGSEGVGHILAANQKAGRREAHYRAGQK